jgi:dephospho-CoA kinase
LLYETDNATRFDTVVVAACSPAQQLERLMARDHLDEAEARERIAAQWPIDRKRVLADLVIETSGTMAETLARVDHVWTTLLESESPGDDERQSR